MTLLESFSWLDFLLLGLLLVVGTVYLLLGRSSISKSIGDTKHAPTLIQSTTGLKSGAASSASTAPSSYSFADRLKEKSIVVFFGSQTGTAEEYAGRLVKEATQFGLKSFLADLMDYEMDELRRVPKEKLVVFVLATYGEGEPTDNARDFHEWLMSDDRLADISEAETHPETGRPLSALRYVMLGLGNKTYEHFNAMARECDKRLQELGAQRLGDRGETDDDGSLEDDYVNWKEIIWPVICGHFNVDPTNVKHELVRSYALRELSPEESVKTKIYHGEIGAVNAWNGKQNRVAYDQKNPFYAKIHAWCDLYAPNSPDADGQSLPRDCLHIELDISGINIRYQAGDHVAVFPTNEENEVLLLAQVLGIRARLDQSFEMKAREAGSGKKFPFPCPATYRAALMHYLDIFSLPKTNVLSALAQYATKKEEKEHLERLACSTFKHEYHQYVVEEGRTLRQILEEHSSITIVSDSQQESDGDGHLKYLTVGDVLELIPRLQPRYYSISSSPKQYPNQIHITAAIARYRTKIGRVGAGVATGYLSRLCHGFYKSRQLTGSKEKPVGDLGDIPVSARIPIFVRNSNFKLPKNLLRPIIMVGPGTGLAPFRGFIQERLSIAQERIRVLEESSRLPELVQQPFAGPIKVEKRQLEGGFHLKRLDAQQHGVGSVLGEAWLFYGCRNEATDFLYRQEWAIDYFPSDRVPLKGIGLTDLLTAFSRDQKKKVYVQNRLNENKIEIWKMLSEKEGYLYVCGDAKNMARDVQKLICEIAQHVGKKTEAEAQTFVKMLREKGRYQEDVWS